MASLDDPSTQLVSKGPCGDCGSDDALALYADGHKYCYKCAQFKGYEEGRRPMDDEAPFVSPIDGGDAVPFTKEYMPNGNPKRKLTLETLSKFGYFRNAEGLEIAPLYDQKGRLVYQKYRNKAKEFWYVKVAETSLKPHECQLYGQQVWGDKYDRKVVVIEGEHDCHSVAQALGFKSAAVVSVPAGTGSALQAVKANYRWLDRFEEVIFWMDGDEAGQALIPALCELFPAKSKTVNPVEDFKDASEILQANRGGDIYGAVWSAVTYQPEGIVNAKDLGDDMLEEEGEVICPWPWPLMQLRTGGIRESEVVYHVAGTGSGKTSELVEIMALLLRENIKFGVLRFEDTRRKAMLDLMSVEAGRRLHLDPMPPDELVALHAKVFGGGTCELFDPEKAKWDFASILAYVRFLVLGLGCRVVLIDPLSFIVAGSNERDPVKALDNVAYEFAHIVKKTKANLQIAHHLKRPSEGKPHEEGRQVTIQDLKGSSGLAAFSMVIRALRRNQQGPRPDLSESRLLKNRFAGWTGVVDILKWDEQLGRNLVTDEAYPEDDDKDNKMPAFGKHGDEGY